MTPYIIFSVKIISTALTQALSLYAAKVGRLGDHSVGSSLRLPEEILGIHINTVASDMLSPMGLHTKDPMEPNE